MPWHVEKIWMSVQRRTTCFSCVLQVWVCTCWLSLWSCKSHTPYTTWVLISNGHICCSSFVCLWRFGIPSNWKPTSRTKYAVEGTFLDSVHVFKLWVLTVDLLTLPRWNGRAGVDGQAATRAIFCSQMPKHIIPFSRCQKDPTRISKARSSWKVQHCQCLSLVDWVKLSTHLKFVCWENPVGQPFFSPKFQQEELEFFEFQNVVWNQFLINIWSGFVMDWQVHARQRSS